jgi:hypothetical protein
LALFSCVLIFWGNYSCIRCMQMFGSPWQSIWRAVRSRRSGYAHFNLPVAMVGSVSWVEMQGERKCVGPQQLPTPEMVGMITAPGVRLIPGICACMYSSGNVLIATRGPSFGEAFCGCHAHRWLVPLCRGESGGLARGWDHSVSLIMTPVEPFVRPSASYGCAHLL